MAMPPGPEEEINVTCPGCGSPLIVRKARDGSTRYVCSLAAEEEPLEPPSPSAPEISRQSEPRPDFHQTIDPFQGSTGNRPHRTVLLAAAFALAGILVALVLIIPSPVHDLWSTFLNNTARISARVMNPVVLAPLPDDNTPDLLALVEIAGSDQYQYALIDGKTRALLWKSPLLSKEGGSQAKAFAANDQVYIVDQTHLTALTRKTGATAWELELENGLGYCATCLRQFGNQVVMILKDGTLQGVNAQTGKLTWTKRLNSTNSDLQMVNGAPGVVEEEGAGKNAFYFIDANSGKVTQRFFPTCNADPYNPSPSDYLVDDGGRQLTVFYYSHCVQRYNLANGQLLSETIAKEGQDDGWPSAWWAAKFLFGPGAVYTTDEGSRNAVWGIDLTTGKGRQLVADNKFSLTPKVVVDGILVVEAQPGYDSNQREVWAIDAQTGNRLWTVPMKGKGDLRYDDVHATQSGDIIVAECREDPGTCNWITVDPRSGKELATGQENGGTFIDVTWGKNILYLVVDTNLSAIDLNSGKTLYRWP